MSLILGTNSIKDTGYEVANSLRFNDGSLDTLQRSPSSASNRKTWTWSCWVKRCTLSTTQVIFVGGSPNTWIRFRDNDKLELFAQEDYKIDVITTMVFRDVSSWYHICVAVDTTQGTQSNRVKIYVNGSLVDVTVAYAEQNYDMGINNTGTHYVGRLNYVAVQYIDMYLSEMVLIDGQQLAPDQFGEFDSDSPTIWKPIDVSGLTFGTNGFYLDFEDSSSLGNDKAGSNNFTVNNLTAIDQTTDTCTNNFATLNPLVPYSSATFSEGNLKIVSQTYASIVSTIAVSQGKWYAEMRSTDISAGTGFMGITSNLPTASNYEAYNQSGSIVGYGVAGNGSAYGNGGGFGSWGGWSNNAIIMMAVDLDNNKLYWGVDGTWGNSSNPSTNTNGGSITPASSTTQGVYWFFCNSQTNDNATLEYNFGSPPYAISSGNADGNGYGNFEHTVPTNYYSLCTKNLAEYG